MKIIFSQLTIVFNPATSLFNRLFSRKTTIQDMNDIGKLNDKEQIQYSINLDSPKDESMSGLFVILSDNIAIEMRDCRIDSAAKFGLTSSSLMNDIKASVFCSLNFYHDPSILQDHGMKSKLTEIERFIEGKNT
mmetsp:Transcript_23119/g.26507  ORF Transcript_23119/g.26507 Transcript_23119/m.26507 type:complete len:134 (-) Transcript_23119:291-692(-)